MAKTKALAVDENDTLRQVLALQTQLESLTAYVKELEERVSTTYTTKAYVNTYIEHMLGEIMPIHDPLTENSSIIGYEPLDIEKVLKRFQNIGGTYTLADYRTILKNYDVAAQ